MSDAFSQQAITEHYRTLVLTHGGGPGATQCSEEGRRVRYVHLLDIGPLDDLEVLDLGCGTGTLYPLLRARYPRARYTGVDIVPEMVAQASRTFPEGRFACRDVLRDGLPGAYDVVLLSALFNNARTDADGFLQAMLLAAFAGCRRSLGFNFISTDVNFRGDEMSYHDPAAVLRFCIERLARRVTLQHHYWRCDVSVFVHR
jgi:SAM-dependent methyltransferase